MEVRLDKRLLWQGQRMFRRKQETVVQTNLSQGLPRGRNFASWRQDCERKWVRGSIPPKPLPKGSTAVKVEGMEEVCAGLLQQERKIAHTGPGRWGPARCCPPATPGQMAAGKQMWVGAGPRALSASGCVPLSLVAPGPPLPGPRPTCKITQEMRSFEQVASPP